MQAISNWFLIPTPKHGEDEIFAARQMLSERDEFTCTA
jgi:hypothetical protein